MEIEDNLKVVQEGYTDYDNEIMLENIEVMLQQTDIPKGNVSELKESNGIGG